MAEALDKFCSRLREAGTRGLARWGAKVILGAAAAAVAAGGTAHAAGSKSKPQVFKGSSNSTVEKVRREFEELGLKMTGMAAFMNEKSVFIRHPGSKDQMIYGLGHIVGGFKVVDIQKNYTVFERRGVQMWLALGDAADLDAKDLEASEEGGFVGLDHKRPEPNAKTKTGAFTSTRIVEKPGFSPKPSEDSGGRKFRSVASAGGSPSKGSIRFVTPLPGRVTSEFGYRKRPTGGARTNHQGIDIQGGEGAPIRAAAAGRIAELSRSWAKGLNILIRHNDEYETAYFHFSKVRVKQGDWVEQGEVIGYEGSTGIATGPHLHFEIHKNGVPQDPALYIRELRTR